jgi:hypothetical protein
VQFLKKPPDGVVDKHVDFAAKALQTWLRANHLLFAGLSYQPTFRPLTVTLGYFYEAMRFASILGK